MVRQSSTDEKAAIKPVLEGSLSKAARASSSLLVLGEDK